MPTFRVYHLCVATYVYDVDADTPEEAAGKVPDDNGKDVRFLHQASDPLANPFCIDVHTYDAEGNSSDDPVYSDNEPVKWWARRAGDENPNAVHGSDV